MKMTKESANQNKNYSLYFVLILVLLAIFQGLRFRNLIGLTSDTLYMNQLTQDLMQNGDFFKWTFSPAPDFIPDFFVYLIAALFVKSATIQLLVVTIFQVCALTILVYVLFRRLHLNPLVSFLNTAFLATSINLYQVRSGEWIYFFTTNNHFSTLFFGLIFLVIILPKLEVKSNSGRDLSNRYLFLIFVCAFLGTLSSITLVYAVILPLCSALLLVSSDSPAKFLHLATKKNFMRITVFSLSGISAGYLFGKVVDFHSVFGNRFGFSTQKLQESSEHVLSMLVHNIVGSGIIDRLLTLILLVTIVTSFTFLMFFGFKSLLQLNLRVEVIFIYLFGNISLVFSTLFVFFSGGIVDRWFLRYFWGCILAILIAMISIISHLLQTQGTRIFRKISTLAAATLIINVVFFSTSISPQPIDAPGIVAVCETELRKQGVELKTAVADYWFARSVDYLTGNKTPSYVALNDLRPFYWMTSANPLRNPSVYKIVNYNYVRVHTDPDPFLFNAQNLSRVLPPPNSVYPCLGSGIEIWFYSDDKLDRVIRSRISDFVSEGNWNRLPWTK